MLSSFKTFVPSQRCALDSSFCWKTLFLASVQQTGNHDVREYEITFTGLIVSLSLIQPPPSSHSHLQAVLLVRLIILSMFMPNKLVSMPAITFYVTKDWPLVHTYILCCCFFLFLLKCHPVQFCRLLNIFQRWLFHHFWSLAVYFSRGRLWGLWWRRFRETSLQEYILKSHRRV